MITRVRADDEEDDPLVFGLDRKRFLEGGGEVIGPDKLPFRIDSDTGVVYLNESLAGRGGEDFPLYVTASDGHLTAKTEMHVSILPKNATRIWNSRTPSYTPKANNFSHLFPPFHRLPGINPPSSGATFPSQLMPNFNPNPNLNFYTPVYNGRPPFLNISPDGESGEENPAPSTAQDTESNSNNSHEGGSRTKLTAVKTDDNLTWPSQQSNASKENTSHGTRKNNKDDADGSVINGGRDGRTSNQTEKTDGSSPPPLLPSSSSGTLKAVIPAIITICGIFLAAGLIVLFIYRKRLCAIGKSLKKKSKEEMAKKSNQSNLSSNITSDDSRNSMVMQHWNGPLAFSNRYVPWERENQHPLATSRLSTSSSTGNTETTKTDRWEFPRHRLKFFNILGEGAFGQVWRCEATNLDGKDGVTTVAVKTLKENATEAEKNDLTSELQVMKSLEPHVNVVRLLGCCTDKDPIFVVIEYVNRGKLQTYLRNSRAERHYGNTHGKSNVLTSGDLTSFMYQVARGMDFLTSRGIIHRDLAARNILITDDHTCKVADFGFARDVITSKVYERKSEGKLPIRWMAIESLYDNIFSVKSDIWSFGILMWEIVTLGSTPYPGISAADVMRKVRDGYRLEKPEHCRRELYNIMYYCWAKDPNERPSFSELVQLLDKLLLTEMDYIELERFPDHNYYNMLSLSGEKL
ncbi:unnamed protein product [Hermetia illucens]|uniref:receptor protein-tyrosine kinase n=2 Tax=Hermetia illucens TaxID=343691 RepID=A0A7R8UNG2_HERIL|nr:unnamed protein product [Hermetia illucens]